jgi:hypothetical protein
MMPDILSLPNKPAGHFQSIAQNAIIVGIEVSHLPSRTYTLVYPPSWPAVD